MVFCTYCGQSFTRDEHLERHILTHTNVKPFKCFTCHMSFARRDLLQRHYTVHGKDQNNQEIVPAANGMIPKSAGRTPIACSNCAKTKTKCDKKFPCSRCAARNLRCTLRPTRRSAKGALRVNGQPDPTAPSATGLQTPVTAGPGKETDQQKAAYLALNGSAVSVESDPFHAAVMGAGGSKTAPPQVDASPSSLLDDSSVGPTSTRPATASPVTTRPTTLTAQTSMSSYEDRARSSHDDSDAETSPHFMLDWSQMQMPLGFDEVVQPHMLMASDMFDPSVLDLGPSSDGVMNIMPELAHQMTPPLITPPMETTKLETALSHIDLQSSPIRPQQRHSSSAHLSVHVGDIRGEMPAIVAGRDAWTCFRCTPTLPSTSCPKTARLNLERLEQTLKNHDGWSTWSPQWDEATFAGGDHLTVMQLHESTRDKLLAITQSFLHKALEIHRDGSNSPDNGMHSLASNFVLLPPARVLEYFLRSYANSFEQYYPLTSRGILDANELMHCYNDRAASLLVLMMIAQGAMNIPSAEARMLTGGLTEACRISLFDLIERNIVMSGDPIVLHSALIFTVQAAWSGDKWQMDIAMGQRGMYFAMLRHSGALESRAPASHAHGQRPNADHIWSDWIHNESRSRLIYSWAMVDQELALFHDSAPLFSVMEFGAPMPDADRLWHSKHAGEWSSIFEQVHEFAGGYSSVGSGARPLSLRDLFRHFLDDEMIPLGIEMTPLQLRLLLHPLQALVCQCGHLLSCFSDTPSGRSKGPRALTAASTRTRLEEVQSLLQRWFDLAERYLKVNAMCPMMQTNLVIFHLISLNAVTDFPKIERLARREDVEGGYQQLLWAHRRCIVDIEEAVFHCGQMLRLVRAMPRGVRPPWWAGAVYRVALILWTDSLTHKDPVPGPVSSMGPVPGPSFAIDALTAEHPLIIRYLTKREGVPCVTKRDGSQMGIDNAFNILQHCIEVIDEGAATRFSDGIRAKLETLARG